MPFPFLVVAFPLSLLSSRVHGFGVVPPLVVQPNMALKRSPMETSSTVLFPIRCYDKYYQLEELEDQDSCTTELFLAAQGAVEFGDTDGPKYDAAEGRWHVPDGTNHFQMHITRTYSTGQDNTDMGTFTYTTTREYTGEMTMAGESVAIAGVAKSNDASLGQEMAEVGYFNMIDATKERLGEEDSSGGSGKKVALSDYQPPPSGSWQQPGMGWQPPPPSEQQKQPGEGWQPRGAQPPAWPQSGPPPPRSTPSRGW